MKLSVITVVYNNSKTIESTIQSVLGQSYNDVEYIIIDGASNDGTINVIQPFEEKISAIVSEPDKGMYDAMNKGIRLASGDAVGLLHADDIYADNKVLEKVATVLTDDEVDACYGDLVYVSEDDLDKIVRYWKSDTFIQGMFAKGWCPPHPTFFVKSKIYRKFGLYDLSYPIANDVELMMRYLEKFKIRTSYIPEILVKMRIGGVSNNSMRNIIWQNQQILKAAKNNSVPINTIGFIWHKLASRLSQYHSRPSNV